MTCKFVYSVLRSMHIRVAFVSIFFFACFKFWMQNNICTNKGSSSLSNLKACVYYFSFFSPNDSPSKTMKNALFFI